MSERLRLKTLCARNSEGAAKEWARSALQLYLQSIQNPAHFASQADWKTRFEQSMLELVTFVERGTLDTPEVTHDDRTQSYDRARA